MTPPNTSGPTPKLNPNAQKWVDALRSGKYRQTVKVLRNVFGYCCLGVACEVAIKNGLQLKVEGDLFDGKGSWLPERVTKWLGLHDACGKPDSGPALTELNDMGKSFSEIADYIEEHAEELGVSA
jgi:hypothetical protein